MTPRHRRFIIPAAVTVAALALTACGGGSTVDPEAGDRSDEYGFQTEGFPIVEETLTLTFGGEKAPLAPDYSTMQVVQQWQEETNIAINWVNLPAQQYQETKALMLASDNLPDALFNAALTDAEIVQLGGNGTIVPLDGLIEKYAPNLAALLDERPDIRAAITAPDGHIYTLPSVEELRLASFSQFLFINTTWLDALGLEMPTTIDEYHEVLRAFRTQDPNGNGVADEIPLTFMPGSFAANPWDLIAALGGIPTNNDHRIVRDGRVEFTANTPEFKAGVQGLRAWFEEGLIDPESFTQDNVTYLAKGRTEPMTLGSFFWWELEEVVGAERMDDFALVPVLEGVNGERLASVQNFHDIGRGVFAITRANEFPRATMRWIDRLFDPVVGAEASWGPIGVTLERDENGMLVQIPPAEGESAGERRQRVSPMGPRILTTEHFETVVAPEPRAQARMDIIAEYFAPFAANEQIPPVMLSTEELDRIQFTEPDINSLVAESFARWIVHGGVEAEWDTFLANLQRLEIDDFIAVWQQAYDRYTGN